MYSCLKPLSKLTLQECPLVSVYKTDLGWDFWVSCRKRVEVFLPYWPQWQQSRWQQGRNARTGAKHVDMWWKYACCCRCLRWQHVSRVSCARCRTPASDVVDLRTTLQYPWVEAGHDLLLLIRWWIVLNGLRCSSLLASIQHINLSIIKPFPLKPIMLDCWNNEIWNAYRLNYHIVHSRTKKAIFRNTEIRFITIPLKTNQHTSFVAEEAWLCSNTSMVEVGR